MVEVEQTAMMKCTGRRLDFYRVVQASNMGCLEPSEPSLPATPTAFAVRGCGWGSSWGLERRRLDRIGDMDKRFLYEHANHLSFLSVFS